MVGVTSFFHNEEFARAGSKLRCLSGRNLQQRTELQNIILDASKSEEVKSKDDLVREVVNAVLNYCVEHRQYSIQSVVDRLVYEFSKLESHKTVLGKQKKHTLIALSNGAVLDGAKKDALKQAVATAIKVLSSSEYRHDAFQEKVVEEAVTVKASLVGKITELAGEADAVKSIWQRKVEHEKFVILQSAVRVFNARLNAKIKPLEDFVRNFHVGQKMTDFEDEVAKLPSSFQASKRVQNLRDTVKQKVAEHNMSVALIQALARGNSKRKELVEPLDVFVRRNGATAKMDDFEKEVTGLPKGVRERKEVTALREALKNKIEGLEKAEKQRIAKVVKTKVKTDLKRANDLESLASIKRYLSAQKEEGKISESTYKAQLKKVEVKEIDLKVSTLKDTLTALVSSKGKSVFTYRLLEKEVEKSDVKEDSRVVATIKDYADAFGPECERGRQELNKSATLLQAVVRSFKAKQKVAPQLDSFKVGIEQTLARVTAMSKEAGAADEKLEKVELYLGSNTLINGLKASKYETFPALYGVKQVVDQLKAAVEADKAVKAEKKRQEAEATAARIELINKENKAEIEDMVDRLGSTKEAVQQVIGRAKYLNVTAESWFRDLIADLRTQAFKEEVVVTDVVPDVAAETELNTVDVDVDVLDGYYAEQITGSSMLQYAAIAVGAVSFIVTYLI